MHLKKLDFWRSAHNGFVDRSESLKIGTPWGSGTEKHSVLDKFRLSRFICKGVILCGNMHTFPLNTGSFFNGFIEISSIRCRLTNGIVLKEIQKNSYVLKNLEFLAFCVIVPRNCLWTVENQNVPNKSGHLTTLVINSKSSSIPPRQYSFPDYDSASNAKILTLSRFLEIPFAYFF